MKIFFPFNGEEDREEPVSIRGMLVGSGGWGFERNLIPAQSARSWQLVWLFGYRPQNGSIF